jgi:hypothetical protein
MPTAATRKVLRVGDVISVPATTFGQAWAKGKWPSDWHKKKIEGTVVGRAGDKWSLRFPDEDDDKADPWTVTLGRKDITFVSHPQQTAVEVEEDDEEAEPEDGAQTDSSEDELDGGDTFFQEEPDHTIIMTGKKAQKIDLSGKWTPADDFSIDQRTISQVQGKEAPVLKLNNGNYHSASLFQLGLHFLPVLFLTAMATEMTLAGERLYKDGNNDFKNWNVTVDDLYQWIGVWMYFLAFPMAGERRAYWQEPPGGWGPRHRLADFLRLGGNGEKSVRWFEKMEQTFKLPTDDKRKDDPFKPTRRWWEALRDAFYSAISPSWILTLDESMVKWMGIGMPGLMVILRKPTPIGLELHTLCCAMCGILVWFEVYEGKVAMEKAEYCDQYGKSVALCLRMTKKFYGQGKVVIADSWFGSVVSAVALYLKGVFCVMNVKTATTNFPKDELMAEVDEIKGKTPEARKARRERRGKAVAFSQTVKCGTDKQCTLLAAGHNKKKPLLVISTYGTMLPADDHNKTWKVNQADGSVELHSLKTPQPEVHALYRLWMNVVDLHNKLRQGVVSMADVWGTVSWEKRHFAEGLGFWEVNVFKAFIYFFRGPESKHQKMQHGDFRARLAFAFMTLGKATYPADGAGSSTADASTPAVGGCVPGTVPLPGGKHEYESWRGRGPKTCNYCGHLCYQKCKTCEDNDVGTFYVCGKLSKRKDQCINAHRNGETCNHGNFDMTSPGKRKMKEAQAKRKDAAAMETQADDESSDDENGIPIGTMGSPRLAAKAKKQRKEAKAAAKAAQQAEEAKFEAEKAALARLARSMKRAMDKA